MNETVEKIRNTVSGVLVGRETTADLVLSAVIAGGSVLLEDMPGTGKTLLAKTFAKALGGVFSRIQFTPDLLPSDVTGINWFNKKTNEFELRKGPVFCNILLADEINRATPRTQSGLLECMEEKQVTIDGTTFALPAPFFVLATENPVETYGTFPLPEAQFDRFLMKLSGDPLSESDERTMIERFGSGEKPAAVGAVCTPEDVISLSAQAKKVFVHPSVTSYILSITRATRTAPGIIAGVSPRGTLALHSAAKAFAFVCGRQFVTPDDVKKLAVPVLAHRIITDRSSPAGTEGSSKELIEKIINTVEAPTEEFKN